MASRYPQFDRDRLRVLPLEARDHDYDLGRVLQIGEAPEPFANPGIDALAEAIAHAHRNGRAVVLLMGAHLIKQGCSRYLCEWIRRGWISVVAMNGACAIHDYELATIGHTSESVARYISEGQFGLWRETGELNDIVRAGNAEGFGFGESVGKFVAETQCPNADISVFAAAYEANVPATVHVGIGYDIIHEHPNADGASTGEASYRDFLIFAKVVENLEGGVVLCYGTAVMGPEVYLKALSMARNVAGRQGRSITDITSGVFDLVRLPEDLSVEAPKDTPAYYYRPFKTVLVRTVRDGGRSHYVRGDHRATVPAMHEALAERLG